MVNLAHVQVMQVVPDTTSPSKLRVSLDLGTRTFSWLPKTAADVAWMEAAIGLYRPGQLPAVARLIEGATLEALPARRAPVRRA